MPRWTLTSRKMPKQSSILLVLPACLMSPNGMQHDVVDPDLKVKKFEGLRVVDGCVLVSNPFLFLGNRILMCAPRQPFIPSAHTQAVVHVFAERAADLIKASYHS